MTEEKLFMPLKFWFNKNTGSIRKPIETPITDSVLHNFRDDLSLEELNNLLKDINSENHSWMVNSMIFYVPFRTKFDEAYDLVAKRIADVSLACKKNWRKLKLIKQNRHTD